MFYHHHFQGIDTEFTLGNLLIILFIALGYALLTSWVFVLFFRWLLPVFDRVFGGLVFVRGLFPLAALLVGALVYHSGPGGEGAVCFLGPFVLLAYVFGYGQAVTITPLAVLFLVGVYAIGWYPVGAWTGIGWMGVIPYTILCLKCVRLYT